MDKEDTALLNRLNEATRRSKCSMCGSESYGKGCIYNARGIHLHMDDPTRCGWCGSQTIYGRGCIYSPTGVHGIGANLYTSMVAEAFITSYLLKKLKTSYVDTKAFDMGVINESGQLIRKPITPEEKAAYTILDSFIFKIKRFLGEKLELISESLYLDAARQTLQEKTSVENYEKELTLKRKLSNISRQFYDTIKSARDDNISEPIIEKTILESFLNDLH